jgi:hypothetical protein
MPSTSSHVSSARAFLEALRRKGAALRCRQGQWQLLSGARGRPRQLPGEAAAWVQNLLESQEISCGDDGLFRPAGVAPQALRDDSEAPWLAVFRGSPESPEEPLVRAGEKLRQDYERAHFSQRMTARYAPRGDEGGGHWRFSDNHMARLQDEALAARQRVHAALDVVGPELSHVLLQVCCHAAGLEQAERILALPRRSGRAVLVLALTRLSRHYGFKPKLRHSGPSRIGHWAVDDYRPAIRVAPSQP